MIPLTQTIAAVATPPGRGGIGIIRVSGPLASQIGIAILGHLPSPRQAEYISFKDTEGGWIDKGIALFFPAPHSFTGEDILELQGHGGPVVLDILLQNIQLMGVRLANPGEFSQRAFLNGKIDLNQAEAIADLINANSQQAARCALRSLQGEFSNQVKQLLDYLIKLRMYVEAAIDFPEEEIDFISEDKVKNDLQALITLIKKLQQSAKQGALLQEGMTVVIVGKPNVGKSSLLNSLCGRETAIVTEIPGTTRDVLRECINIDGMPLHIIDTAGLRQTDDPIEQEGIRRARLAMQQADVALHIVDANKNYAEDDDEIQFLNQISEKTAVVKIRNKIDLIGELPGKNTQEDRVCISLSAKYQQGVEFLKEHLKHHMGFTMNSEGVFIARRRHLEAVDKTLYYLQMGQHQLSEHRAGELLAEDLRQAQQALNEITGEFSADELLGKIFSNFCIGK